MPLSLASGCLSPLRRPRFPSRRSKPLSGIFVSMRAVGTFAGKKTGPRLAQERPSDD